MTRRILSDAQWTIIEPYCLGKASDPGQTGRDPRLFVEAVLWIVRTGAQWRELPIEFGIASGLGSGGARGVPDFRPRRGGIGAANNGAPPQPPEPPPEPLGNEFPVPAEPFPVPESNEEIPEPTTAILLGLGGLSLFSGRRQRKQTS